MEIPPQPPPDAPAPPPGPEAIRSRKKMRIICWIGGLALAFTILLGLLSPVILRSRIATERTEAIYNLKQINLALIDFENDYGRFPDASTIADVRAASRSSLALGTATSNDYFRQLIANGTKSEKIFWAPTPSNRRRPDDVISPDALVKGECVFSYVAGLSYSDDPSTPVAMALMKPGIFQFDPTAFSGKAVVLRIDGSVNAETIRSSDNEVITRGGMTLFDPHQPYWSGKPPDLKWPE